MKIPKFVIHLGAVFLAFVLLCFGFLHWIVEKSEMERRETHRAWQALHPETPIPFEDWQRLKSAYLLPGQQRPIHQ